ncbi:hypothetical protein [Synechococcus sp. MU1625]|uniref:hypothetical protein n=1 Tax=Synechococcus sp. MU1625 TaxID=2508347 RepID=UPI001CF802D2|nr:hypothetical protein [Synechococcus sp. MU1625]MCB4398578.1 hypothetical protein [Synechococcus sp. MU1625]
MTIEKLEQLAAVIVTAGLVAGNFLLFTPWRDGRDPRQQHPESSMPQNSRSLRFIGMNTDFNATDHRYESTQISDNQKQNKKANT